MFSSANGNIADNPYDAYPRDGQEIGRLLWHGTTDQTLIPSTVNPPAFISVTAATDWDSSTANTNSTNMYFASKSSAGTLLNSPEVFLAYQDGKVILAGGADTTSVNKGIHLAPAKITAGDAHDTYVNIGTSDHEWLTVNYANTSGVSGGQTGSEVVVRQGYNSGSAGDIKFAIKRDNISASQVTADLDSLGIGGAFFPGNYGGLDADDVIVSVYEWVTAGNTMTFESGMAMTFAGVQGPGNANVNGQTFYMDGTDPFGAGDSFTIFTDAALTTPASFSGLGISEGNTGEGNVTFTPTAVSGVEYKWDLNSATSDLAFKVDDTTKITYHENGNVTFANNISYANQTNGTVTSVDSGAGLTGGPITGSGTLAIGQGYGITVNADDIELDNAAVQAQANALFNSKTSDDLTEGATNLYFTTDNANTAIGNYTGNMTNVGYITPSDIKLDKFQETVSNTATTTGNVFLNVRDNGTVFRLNTTGDCTLVLSNPSEGSSFTCIITYGGAHTVGHTGSWKFAGGNKTFSNTSGKIDVVSGFYAGGQAYVSLTTDYS